MRSELLKSESVREMGYGTFVGVARGMRRIVSDPVQLGGNIHRK